MTKNLSVAIVGASGNAGGELCRLLLTHPRIEEIWPIARTSRPFDEVHPNLRGAGLEFVPWTLLEAVATDADVVFFCLPPGESMKLIPGLVDTGRVLVDLGPDFRFPSTHQYTATYGGEHEAEQVARSAVYGLTELNRSAISRSHLTANPGCYASIATLAIAPLMREKMVANEVIHVAAVNGTSGGTKVEHLAASNSLMSYSLKGHRHVPEIEAQGSSLLETNYKVSLSTAHGDFARGLHLQATVPLREQYRGLKRADFLDLFVSEYGDGLQGDFFIRINSVPGHADSISKDYEIFPRVKQVLGSNMCHIGLDVDERLGLLKLVAVADNLGKGAAGSAIQNMNLMCNLNETTGLAFYGTC